MNRRSVLSFLGIGAVGASTLDAQAGIMPSTRGATYDIGYSIVKESNYASPMVEDRAITLKKMQDELFGFTSDPAKWVADRLAEEMKDWRMGYSGIRYENIDPDIRNMKSITEAAKMRMYFERKVKRQMEINQTSLTHRISEYLGVKI